MTENEIKKHVEWLFGVLEERGLNEAEMIAVVGYLVSGMLTGDIVREAFIATLRREWCNT